MAGAGNPSPTAGTPVPGGISILAIDATRGLAAAGLLVELHALTPQAMVIASGPLNTKGFMSARSRDVPAQYEARFHIGPWYRRLGMILPQPAFLEIVPYRFGIARPEQHCHLPLQFTPWGFSLFRGLAP